MNILVTGGSGLLGRAVIKRLSTQTNHRLTGLCFTRSGSGLKNLDLCDQESVTEFIQALRPDVLIHCAAERRPDVAERDPEAAEKLNVRVTEHLTELSNQLDFKIVYISTDYVFDGHAPEGGYDVDAVPNPTNFYGKTKLAGEQAMLKIGRQGKVVSLRVPVLYGEAQKNEESAINVLIDGVKKALNGQKVLMDDWATRYPTLVDDVAKVLEALVDYKEPLPPILHFSSSVKYTKYTISLIFAGLLGLSQQATQNLIPQPDGPKPGSSETIRPKDCRLSNRALDRLGIRIQTADFSDWWKEYLNRT